MGDEKVDLGAPKFITPEERLALVKAEGAKAEAKRKADRAEQLAEVKRRENLLRAQTRKLMDVLAERFAEKPELQEEIIDRQLGLTRSKNEIVAQTAINKIWDRWDGPVPLKVAKVPFDAKDLSLEELDVLERILVRSEGPE